MKLLALGPNLRKTDFNALQPLKNSGHRGPGRQTMEPFKTWPSVCPVLREYLPNSRPLGVKLLALGTNLRKTDLNALQPFKNNGFTRL